MAIVMQIYQTVGSVVKVRNPTTEQIEAAHDAMKQQKGFIEVKIPRGRATLAGRHIVRIEIITVSGNRSLDAAAAKG